LYVYKSTDASGERVKKLNKSHLPNHRIYDPNKGDYSLLPFRNESDDLLNTGQTAEDVFNLFIEPNSNIQEHHEKLTKILQA